MYTMVCTVYSEVMGHQREALEVYRGFCPSRERSESGQLTSGLV